MGEFKYIDDIEFLGMFVGWIFWSIYLYVCIKKIDVSKVLVLLGVVVVCIGDEVFIKFGVLFILKDENVLVVEKVCYIGDSVVVVVVEDEEMVEWVLELIEVEYEMFLFYFCVIDCIKLVDEKIYVYCQGDINIYK